MILNKKSILFLPIFFGSIIIVLLIGFFLLFNKRLLISKPRNNQQMHVSEETKLLAKIAVWYPTAPWNQPIATTQTTYYGKLSGESITAKIKTDQAILNHFEDVETLRADGFTPDILLEADGAGSSSWGYKNVTTNQIILFSYKTKPTSTHINEPVQFNCPCIMDLSVFVSNANKAIMTPTLIPAISSKKIPTY